MNRSCSICYILHIFVAVPSRVSFFFEAAQAFVPGPDSCTPAHKLNLPSCAFRFPHRVRQEKLALTTCGLLTQHHDASLLLQVADVGIKASARFLLTFSEVVNPSVMDKKSYVQMSAAEPPKSEPKPEPK